MTRHITAQLSVVLALSLMGCGGAEPSPGDATLLDTQREASAELAQHGVHSYQVTEQEHGTHVLFEDASLRTVGEMTLLGERRGEYTHLDLSWSGKQYAFDMDLTHRVLTVNTGGQSAKLAAGSQANQFTGDAAAMELYARIEPQWKLITSTLDALAATPDVQTFSSNPAVKAQSAGVTSMESTCAYCATWESCSFFWHRNYWGFPIGNGLCQGGSACSC